jgi:hypothetical protein
MHELWDIAWKAFLVFACVAVLCSPYDGSVATEAPCPDCGEECIVNGKCPFCEQVDRA